MSSQEIKPGTNDGNTHVLPFRSHPLNQRPMRLKNSTNYYHCWTKLPAGTWTVTLYLPFKTQATPIWSRLDHHRASSIPTILHYISSLQWYKLSSAKSSSNAHRRQRVQPKLELVENYFHSEWLPKNKKMPPAAKKKEAKEAASPIERDEKKKPFRDHWLNPIPKL